MSSYPDFYWLNEESKQFLQRGYLMEGKTAEARVREIAEYAEHILGIEGYADKFYNYMAKGYYSLSTPVWSNFGAGRSLPISCFGSVVTDSVAGIMETATEIAMMGKEGGGTSAYFGKVRPRGSTITNNGKSDGSFTFLKIYEAVIEVISQGTSRRSQLASYIDIDHGDIEEWLDIHTEGNPIQLSYYGVCISDDWMRSMIEGDKYKRQIWAKVLQRRSETGIPYLFFKDNVNNNKPDVYKDKNMTIHASNMCVAYDTKILTKEKGHVEIGSVVGEKLTVWNGKEWSENVEMVKTGENQKLLEVVVNHSNGCSTINATEYHKWHGEDGNIYQTNELYPRLMLESFKLPDGVEVDEVEVIEINEISGLHDTYCCTEPKRNKVVFNGVLTGNCNEIYLPSSEEESFVCCLASMNLLHFDSWKLTDAVETLAYFLEAVMTVFIRLAKLIPHMGRAVRFAERHRALGLGVLGWHSYLQSNMIPFESFQAMQKNAEVFRFIKERTYKASAEMAERYGEPELLKGYGRRHTTTMAIAPTKSSSFILGAVSPSIEPFKSNYYVKDLAKIKTVYKNPFLEKLLDEKGFNTEEIWQSILINDGSVQHLDILTEDEKNVFKTFSEISQMTVIQQAAQRQAFIDQGQSINVMIHPDTPTKDVNKLYITAWELGLKGLYYQFSISAAQRFNRDLLTACASCEA